MKKKSSTHWCKKLLKYVVFFYSGAAIFWLCLHWSVHFWNDYKGGCQKKVFLNHRLFSKCPVTPHTPIVQIIYAVKLSLICSPDDRPGSHSARWLLFPWHVEPPGLHRGGGSSHRLCSDVSHIQFSLPMTTVWLTAANTLVILLYCNK